MSKEEKTSFLQEQIQNANSSVRACLVVVIIGTFTLTMSLLALLVNLELYLKGAFSLFDDKTIKIGLGIFDGLAVSAGGLIGAYHYGNKKKELVNQLGSIDT